MKLVINKRKIGIISFLMFFILILPVKVLAVEEDEPVVSLDSLVVNSMENEIYNITIIAKTDASVAEPIDYKYTVFLVTNISDEGKEMVSGRGTTGEEVTFDVDMNRINSFPEYRFKIRFEYEYNGNEEFSHGFSQKFEYEQQSYEDEAECIDYIVDVTGNVINLRWSSYELNGDKLIISSDIDGEVKEEMIEADECQYDIFFEKDSKVVTIKVIRVKDGLMSKGKETVIKLDNTDKRDFYLKFPEEKDRYSIYWNVRYFNGDNTTVKWYLDDKSPKEITLNTSGSFMIDIFDENAKELTVEYNSSEHIMWKYVFPVVIGDFAPQITFLENYDGITINGKGTYTIVGFVDDKYAKVTANGLEVNQSEDGSFYVNLELKSGKNVFVIQAENAIGKTSKSEINIYNTYGTGVISKIQEYRPFIQTLAASILVIVVMLVVLHIRRKRNAKKENK